MALRLERVTPHISRVPLSNLARVNLWVVHEPDGDVLVDPGPVGVASRLLALDRHGVLSLARIVLTHAHPAHAGAVARIVRGTGCRVYLHPDEAPFLDGRRAPLLPDGATGRAAALLGRFIDLCPPVFRLEHLRPGEPLGSLLPVPTPGHSPGHVCLYHAPDRALFLGDAAPADPRLAGLDFRLALPGHGDTLSPAKPA